MFQNLSDRLTKIFHSLSRQGALSEEEVTQALREIRIALLEADVALPVVKEFIEKVKMHAIGQEVLASVTPAQMVIKLVYDQLVTLLGSDSTDLNLAVTPPAIILMVGLQGSGKTTTTAKLGKLLTEKYRKKVLLASLDIYRPAAQEQLEILAKTIGINSLPILSKESPEEITKRALKMAKIERFDVVLLDTAGRLHVDDALMEELKKISKISTPVETLLVADAMTGQDAVNIAKSFHEKLTLTGIILTRLDGDARGGAALSMRQVTGCPIKFIGVGEKVDQLEVFHPERIANRILDKGDIISLVEKAIETIDKEDIEKLNKKIEKGSFDLEDMSTQLQQMVKMGGFSGLMKFLPGMGQLKDKIPAAGADDSLLKKQIAIIRSMNPRERRDPKLLNASRKIRVAKGSGTSVQEINRLLKQFEGMTKMMKQMNKLGKKGFARNGLKGIFG